MASGQFAASVVAGETLTAQRRKLAGFFSSSSMKSNPTKHVVSLPALRPCSVFASSSTMGSSPQRVRMFSNRVGLQIIACSSPVNALANVPGSATTSDGKLEAARPFTEEEMEVKALEEPTPGVSISGFMADVANLVKLVDSRDIIELEMKHKDYEIVIRKKEALPPPPQHSFPGPHVMGHTSYPEYLVQSLSPPPPPAAEFTPAPAPAPASPPPSQYPAMLSPMAGTFYRSPAPTEPAFVQVGDKVTKGQVLCIIEAMKLMNEIEADQSGTVIEIVAEDGKPVSIESPLYIIKP